MSTFQKELQQVINRYSKENGSDTPDFILAEYLEACLVAFDVALQKRETWYGRSINEKTARLPDPNDLRQAEEQ